MLISSFPLSSHLLDVQSCADLQAFVTVLLRIVLGHRFGKYTGGDFRIAKISHRYVETKRTKIIDRNFENIGVIQSNDETFLFDVRFDRPCLLILIQEGDRRWIGGEWINNNREDS